MGRKILNDIGLNFEEQININDKFIVDVYIPDYNLIIQWDGDYWHCHSKYKNPDDRQLKRKKIDKSQNAYFKKCGYKLLRFWGSEIRKEIDDNSEYIRRRIQSITG
jgi:very-short-patch-repair endonuclease